MPATCFIYGLMIHSVQIDPLRICSKEYSKVVVKHTVVLDDQALHGISHRLRKQDSTNDDIGNLLSCVCVVSSRWKRYGRSWKSCVEQ